MFGALSTAVLLEKLKEKTGKNQAELEALAREKSQRFHGLLSQEAALFLLAKEAGITVDEKPLQPQPINQLQAGSTNVDVIGTVKKVFPPKEFQNKNKPGTGRKASVLIADATGEIFAAFWHADTEKTQTIPVGATLLLRNVSVSSFNNQTGLNFGYRSEIRINPAEAAALSLPTIEIRQTTLGEIKTPAVNLNVQATVEEVQPIYEFTKSNKETGKLQRIRLTDGEAELQAVAWNEKTTETDRLKPGMRILLENTRAKQNLRAEMELSIDSNTRIVVTEKKDA